MNFISPLTLFWLLIVGGAASAVLARFRARYSEGAALSITLLALLLWLAERAQIPIELTVLEWGRGVPMLTWNWRVDEVAWQLTAWLLLLAVGVLLARLGANISPEAGDQETSVTNPYPAPLILFLTAAAGTAIWANSLASILLGWALFTAVWGAAMITAANGTESQFPRALSSLRWPILALLFIWLAAATSPAGSGPGLDFTGWPRNPTSALLTAALLQMGIWPFHGWRQVTKSAAPLLQILLHIIPTLVGAALLARLVATSDISMGYSLFLTAFGLLGMLLGLQRAWLSLHDPARMVMAVALVQSSIVLLTGVWAGAAALAAEMRVLLLAVTALALFSQDGRWRTYRWRLIPLAVLLAAIIGLPLTAGFAGRAALYNSWIENGRYLMLLTSTLLFFPYLIVILLIGRKTNQDDADDQTAPPAPSWRLNDILLVAGLLLPLLGLLSLSAPTLSSIKAGTWLALFAPLLAGVALLRFPDDLRHAGAVLDRAFAVDLPFDRIRENTRVFLNQIGTAIHDAAAILEGEGGMFWLIVIVIVFLMTRL